MNSEEEPVETTSPISKIPSAVSVTGMNTRSQQALGSLQKSVTQNAGNTAD